MKRTNPFQILRNTKRFLPLLLLPLIRGVLAALQGNFYLWLKGTWFDFAVIIAIVALSTLRWFVVRYRVDQEGFTFHTGLFVKKQVHIPFGNIVSMFVEQPLVYRFFRVARLSVDSLGGESKEFDIDLVLNKQLAFTILKNRQKQLGDQQFQTIYMPRPLYVTFLALISSNSFTGIVLFVATALQLLNLLETTLKTQVLSQFENLLTYFNLGFPPLINLAFFILLLGYFLAFFSHFLNNKDFTIRKGEHTLYINSGFTTLSDYSILLREIQAIDIRQNLLARLFRLYTVRVETAGYGKRTTKIPILIPAARYGDLLFILDDLLPEMLPATASTIRPTRRALFSYLNLPIVLLLLSPAGYFLSIILLPNWREIFLLFYSITAGIAIWLGAIRLFAFQDAGISTSNSSYTIRYSNRLTIHTVIIPANKLVCFTIKQLPFQKIGNRCAITFYTYSERNHFHRIQGLPYHKLLETFFSFVPK